ncbi:hypothetical protein COCNU_01G013630 [Cocos nucifera]|uniref:PGG domain-containing protein n=1 Tax=Cocos nucifera TaxID=13894 RepID=A0A8K0MV84_COCNU|nr:hypothetical protein COCNU_01G013630 [Cocos nucifera]
MMLDPAATRSDAVIDGEIDRKKQMKDEWVREMRGWLMVLAVLAASVTYQAGLNPPGGFWQDSNDEHTAGYPILADKALRRYVIFYIFNSMAFVNSIIIIVLLMKVTFFYGEVRLNVLRTWLLLDLVWLIGAYVAATTRETVSSVIAVVLQVVIFPIVAYDVWCRERSTEKFPMEQRGDVESRSNRQRPS